MSPVSRSQNRSVTAATCGLTSTRGWRHSGWPGGSGSVANTSSAAPRSWPASSSSSSARSSSSDPRDTFTTIAPRGSRSSTPRSTAPCVSAVWGAAITRQSLSAASRGTSSPPPPPPPPPRPPPPHPPDARRPALLRPSPHARDRHPERERAARDRAADAPETEDAQSHVAELPHREAKVRELFPRPRFRGLRLAHPVEAAGEVRDGRQGPIGDRFRVHGRRIREDDRRASDARQARAYPGRGGVHPPQRLAGGGRDSLGQAVPYVDLRSPGDAHGLVAPRAAVTVRDGRLPHLHDLPAAAQRLANRRHGPRRDAPGRVGRGEVHHQPAGHSPDDTVRTPGWWSSATIT